MHGIELSLFPLTSLQCPAFFMPDLQWYHKGPQLFKFLTPQEIFSRSVNPNRTFTTTQLCNSTYQKEWTWFNCSSSAIIVPTCLLWSPIYFKEFHLYTCGGGDEKGGGELWWTWSYFPLSISVLLLCSKKRVLPETQNSASLQYCICTNIQIYVQIGQWYLKSWLSDSGMLQFTSIISDIQPYTYSKTV